MLNYFSSLLWWSRCVLHGCHSSLACERPLYTDGMRMQAQQTVFLCSFLPAGSAFFVKTLASHSSPAVGVWTPINCQHYFCRGDNTKTHYHTLLPQVAEGSFPINKSNYITALQSCAPSIVFGCFSVRACIQFFISECEVWNLAK